METIKCLVAFGEQGEQERDIIVGSKELRENLEAEIVGSLPFMPEFMTTKNETISGDQILCKL